MYEPDPLSDLLKTWRHTTPDRQDFNRGVWNRLQARPATTEPRGLSRLLPFPNARWAMPLAASVVLLLSLAAGSGAALAYDSITRDDRMASEYARSIDPLQMMMAHPPSR